MQRNYLRELGNEEIIKGFENNDMQVLVHLYKTSFRSVKNFILKNNGSEEDAKDVFQEGLLTIWKKIENNSINLTSKFYTYLFAVCKFIWLDELRKRNNKHNHLKNFLSEEEKVIETDLNLELEHLQKQRKELFLHYFNKLNEVCKALIIYHLRGISIKRIREKLGYSSDDYAKFRKYSCKKTLIQNIVNSPKFKELC